MNMSGKELGNLGESIAAKWLHDSNGFEITERNWRCKDAEIDLIAKHDDTIRIIEVKSRMESAKESIANSLARPKMRKLVKGADSYMSTCMNAAGEIFFDLVTVIFSRDMKSHSVEYTPCFFYPEWC